MPLVSGPSLSRRYFLGTAAALAAGAVVSRSASTDRAETANEQAHSNDDPVIVSWDARSQSWPERPRSAGPGVVFDSSDDALAVPPSNSRLRPGDIWRCHADGGIW